MSLFPLFRSPWNFFRWEMLLANSNLSRALFDLIVLSASAFAAALFALAFRGESQPIFFAVPLLGLSTNLLVGVYGRFRVGGGAIKGAILSLSALLVTLFIWSVTGDGALALLWLSLAWAPMALPRMFLNLNRRVEVGALSRSLSQAIKGRVRYWWLVAADILEATLSTSC